MMVIVEGSIPNVKDILPKFAKIAQRAGERWKRRKHWLKDWTGE
jgi:hypothetical protein